MNTISVKTKDIKKLKRYPLDNNITSTESSIYLYKNDFIEPSILLKKIFINSKPNMTRKIETIKKLEEYKEEYSLDELVVPHTKVKNKGEVIGFLIDEVDSIENLGLLLHNNNVLLKEKLKYLYKIKDILAKTISLDGDLFLGDLHEYNFLIDTNDELKVVDLDGAAVTSEEAIPSSYLARDKKLKYINKYRFDKYGIPYPDTNSDIFCYYMMFLETIANHDISRLSMDEYYDYLNYLEDAGYNPNLLNVFYDLYSEGDNILLLNIEELVPSNPTKAYYKVYKKVKNK